MERLGSPGSRGRRRFYFLAPIFLTTTAASGGAEPIPALTPARIAEIAIPSVVLIRTAAGQGSGFVAAPDGKIVTNYHVIQGADAAIVVTSDGVEHKDVEVIALDTAHDLAVLRIGARTLKPLTLADSSLSKPGEHVVAIGNPLGFGDTISDGLLSGVRALKNLTFLQISAPISPGSSGGPVFNDRGEVIGVSTFVVSTGQNLNFAIPINAVKSMLASNKGSPLSAYAAAAPRRSIPVHPLSLLDDCSPSELQSVVGAIAQAIDVGAPLYNQGNFEACYRIYAGAALEVQRGVSRCVGPKKALSVGLATAEKQSNWSAKAWAMRDSFDGLIAVVLKKEGRAGAIVAVERHVPLVPSSALDACPTDDVASIATALGEAVESAAPLFNGGNAQATVRIYEGAVGEIDRKYARCEGARQVLRDGLRNADQADGWPAKAWALRDSFDGLGNAIAARRGGGK